MLSWIRNQRKTFNSYRIGLQYLHILLTAHVADEVASLSYLFWFQNRLWHNATESLHNPANHALKMKENHINLWVDLSLHSIICKVQAYIKLNKCSYHSIRRTLQQKQLQILATCSSSAFAGKDEKHSSNVFSSYLAVSIYYAFK